MAAIGTAESGRARRPRSAAAEAKRVIRPEDLRSLSERSDLPGLARLAAHLAIMAATAALVWLALGTWWLLVPAMVLHGIVLVACFAPFHEGSHYTAFRSRWLNDVVGWLAGAVFFNNVDFYREFHAAHHKYTQDPERDPERDLNPPRSRGHYLWLLSGLPYWRSRLGFLRRIATGRFERMPYVAPAKAPRVVASSRLQIALYAAIAVASVVAGSPAALVWWIGPVFLAMPFLRAYLIAEHTGCTEDDNGLTNTRTTRTLWPVRLLMWNMPFHAEHHLYPSIPFHRLPQAHAIVRDRLAHLGDGYVAVNREVYAQLPDKPLEKAA